MVIKTFKYYFFNNFNFLKSKHFMFMFQRKYFSINLDKDELKKKLSPLQYHVTRECGTERPFQNEYYNHKEEGTYQCIVCDTDLFRYLTS